jgi:hypothetical protein
MLRVYVMLAGLAASSAHAACNGSLLQRPSGTHIEAYAQYAYRTWDVADPRPDTLEGWNLSPQGVPSDFERFDEASVAKFREKAKVAPPILIYFYERSGDVLRLCRMEGWSERPFKEKSVEWRRLTNEYVAANSKDALLRALSDHFTMYSIRQFSFGEDGKVAREDFYKENTGGYHPETEPGSACFYYDGDGRLAAYVRSVPTAAKCNAGLLTSATEVYRYDYDKDPSGALRARRMTAVVTRGARRITRIEIKPYAGHAAPAPWLWTAYEGIDAVSLLGQLFRGEN